MIGIEVTHLKRRCRTPVVPSGACSMPCSRSRARAAVVEGAPLCSRCLGGLRAAHAAVPPPGVDAWAACFAYRGVGRELVARVKYRNTRAVVPWLASMMVETVLAHGLDAATVTWAPTSVRAAPRARLRSGGDPGAGGRARVECPVSATARSTTRVRRRPGLRRRRAAPALVSRPGAPHLRACCSSTTSPLPGPRSRRPRRALRVAGARHVVVDHRCAHTSTRESA